MTEKLTIPVTAPFPLQLERQTRIEAARLGVSRAELVRRATVDYLEKTRPVAVTDKQPERGTRESSN